MSPFAATAASNYRSRLPGTAPGARLRTPLLPVWLRSALGSRRSGSRGRGRSATATAAATAMCRLRGWGTSPPSYVSERLEGGSRNGASTPSHIPTGTPAVPAATGYGEPFSPAFFYLKVSQTDTFFPLQFLFCFVYNPLPPPPHPRFLVCMCIFGFFPICFEPATFYFLYGLYKCATARGTKK